MFVNAWVVLPGYRPGFDSRQEHLELLIHHQSHSSVWQYCTDLHCHVMKCDYRRRLDLLLDLLDSYRSVTTSNYNRFTNSHTLQFTTEHTRSSQLVTVFSSRCLVAAYNKGCSPSSGFPNYPRPQLPASNSSTSQQLSPRGYLTNSPINFSLTDSTD
jgi:hypothetical protein